MARAPIPASTLHLYGPALDDNGKWHDGGETLTIGSDISADRAADLIARQIGIDPAAPAPAPEDEGTPPEQGNGEA